MLKINKQCNVCKAVKEDKKLLQEIYETNFYMKRSRTSLMQLHAKYEDLFSYRGLLAHVKNHQFMSEDDYNTRNLQSIAKKAEKDIIKKQLESKDVWDTVLDIGMAGIQSGEIPMRAADVLKAAKDKSDYDLKTKDQEIAMAQMMWFFASGENKESRSYDRRIIEGQTATGFDATQAVTNDSGAGSDESSDIYHSITWDALTQGPSQVPDGNDQAEE